MDELGWTESDIRHAINVHEIYKMPGGEDELIKEQAKGRQGREKAAARAVLKRHRVRDGLCGEPLC
jgi:hypothetical protein